MSLTSRLRSAWHGLTGRRDPYAATYGIGSGSGFAGAALSRLTASLSSWSQSVNADNDLALPVLRARARSLAANNEHGKRFVGLCAMNIVGRRNPRLQVRAVMAKANPKATDKPALDKSANDAIEIHYERWGKTADVSGKHKSIYAFYRTAVRAVARDGETLIRIVRDRSLPYGLGLQLLEADRMPDDLNQRLTNGNTIRQGVEINSYGRAVAYHIKTAHPGELWLNQDLKIERVPAQDVIHLFLPDRAEQVRGVTWMHAVIIRASVIHKFEEAAVIAAHIGASKIAALERADDAPDSTLSMADGTSNGRPSGIPQMSIEAGELFELPPGYKLSSWNPEYPHANFDSFLKACHRGLASGLDVAAHNLTGNMADVNYSSARIAELTERETWMLLQDWFIETCCAVVYEEWIASALLMRAITFEQSGNALPADKLDKFKNASRFQGKRWAWVDPLKEAEANTAQLENKLTSRTRLAAEQGDEFDDILEELAQEQEAIKAAGLPDTAAPMPKPGSNPGGNGGGTGDSANLNKALEEMRELVRKVVEISRKPAPPPQHIINVSTPSVDARTTINVPEQRQPDVHVTNNVEPTPVTLEATINTPAVRVENRVDVPPASVTVTPEVTVNLPSRKTTTDITSDAEGNIIQTVAVETDL